MEITIRGKVLEVPIVQGGMGVGISLEKLAGAVAACGGMGTISTAWCGFADPEFEKNPNETNLRVLGEQIRKAKEIAKGKGMVAVNAMVATTQYAESVVAALKAGADAIVCGAGLPKDLPKIAAQVPESNAALAPIVSSGRAAALMCKMWKRFNRLPDFVVLEGPLAGGHLGFTKEEAQEAQEEHFDSTDGIKRVKELLVEVLEALEPFKKEAGRDIPVIVGGGIRNGADLRELMELGAAGGQFATRFIATEECDASDAYKQALVDAKQEDITIIQSPVGMPGRALFSPLMQRVKAGLEPKVKKCNRCIVTCNPATTPYCISKALVAARNGDWEHGLFFCGANAGQVNKISTVKEQIDQIMEEWSNAR